MQNVDPTIQGWLALQFQFLEQAAFGIVLMGTPPTGPFEVMARWPAATTAPLLLEKAARKTLSSNQHSVAVQRDPKGRYSVLCCPIIAGGNRFGVIAVLLKTVDAEHIHRTSGALEWGCQWFSWLARERKRMRQNDQRLLGLIQLVAISLRHDGLHASARAVADALREHIGCARVSLGMAEAQQVKLQAISGHDVTSAALRKPLEQAMTEAIDQGTSIVLDRNRQGDGRIVQAHSQLLKQHALNSVVSIPLLHDGNSLGVLTLEQLPNDDVDDTLLHFCEQATLLLAPILQLKRQPTRAAPSPTRLTSKLTPVQKRRLLIATIVTALLVPGIPWPYKVTARAALESQQKQVISAAQDGFIASAMAKAGAHVSAGQILAQLDNRDLTLEQQKWQGKYEQHLKAYNGALGSHERVEIRIHKARLDQAAAQLALIDNQLDRLALKTPFDGIVVAGDLSQSLGAPVKRGDVLFEVARAGHYELLLEIDERDIADVTAGQAGRVLLSSLPRQPLRFRVELVTPVARTIDGRHFFEVRASLTDTIAELSPGMTGVANVDVEWRSLGWIWFHRAWHWLRFLSWRI